MSRDGGTYVARPETYEQVREVVSLANRMGFTLTPAGTRSHTIGPPRRADVVLSTLELRGVVEVSRANSFITAKAGTLMEELERRLSEDELLLPFPYKGTLGGLASVNSPGYFSAWVGFPRNFLLGARLVTGYGSLVLSGGRTAKFSSGYKIWKSLSGTLGWLGIYVELTFRTLPEPEEVKVGSFSGDWRSTLKYRPWGILYLAHERKWIGVFAGSRNYVRSVSAQLDLTDESLPELEASCPRVVGLHVTRGTEAEVLSSLSPEWGVGFVGTGYSRLCTEESEESLRSKVKGYVVVERGSASEYWGFSSPVLCALKRALDPQGVLSPGVFDNCLPPSRATTY
ncbi:glycolate oxidase [Sulfodiicoccus acidiphilus]|uniref:Glycolate oxidase n=2 Tax=Sulfodiicoccus acidiphilus TaxID=1670455 RepID=A0A830H4I8_9CREN|nr:glycolate oxidase [Sulfodiicoccus acidiphilus]